MKKLIDIEKIKWVEKQALKEMENNPELTIIEARKIASEKYVK
jgi:hypothetical protein